MPRTLLVILIAALPQATPGATAQNPKKVQNKLAPPDNNRPSRVDSGNEPGI